MIGAFVAAYFVGKKPVMQSLIFWLVLLVIGWVLAAYAYGVGTWTGILTNFIIGIIIFMLAAILYLRVDPKTAFIMYILSLAINVGIGVISGVAFGLANIGYGLI